MKPSFTTTIDGVTYSAITIAPQATPLPSFLLSGEKQPSYLYDGVRLTPWYWHGFSVVDEMRILTFAPLQIEPFTTLATSRRAEALALVRKTSEALLAADEQFLRLFSGTIALWRLWVTADGKILILSEDLGDLFASLANEEERYFNLAAWVHHNIHPPFTLIDQMVSLLYFSATGTPPFYPKDVREDSFRPVPLALLETGLPGKTATFIDSSLVMGLKQMRTISGNKKPHQALGAFLEASESIEWNLKNRETVPSLGDQIAGEKGANFVEKQAKRAKSKAFLRRRGWTIFAITLSLILVGIFVGGRIKEALAPPYTVGYTQTEVIEAYYQGQNNLDIIEMDTPLAKKVKNPFTMEVTSLFVTRQTRQAYEQINVHVNPQTWLDAGKPPIDQNALLYGVSDIEITTVSDTLYRVTANYWSPFSTEEGGMIPYVHTLEQTFTVEMGKKGWYEITALSNPIIGDGAPVAVPRIESVDTPRFE